MKAIKMIKLNDNRTALTNLKATIDAIDQLDFAIGYFSVEKPGPAYAQFSQIDGPGKVDVQFDRSVIVPALKEQRRKLSDYLATLGIEA